MSDRTDHYVPQKKKWNEDGMYPVPITPDDAKEIVFVTEHVPGIGRALTRRKAAWGLPDELNRDPGGWRWADYSDTTEDGGAHWSRFDGHRVLVDIDIRQENERIVNDWKGRDEIRGRTWAKVRFNGQPVWEQGAQNVPALLLRLNRDIPQLLDLGPLIHHVTDEGDAERQARFGLIGRKVYYRDHPGIITRFIGEQGCVIIEPDPGPWSPIPWRDDDDERDEDAKSEILSPHIWWWRDDD